MPNSNDPRAVNPSPTATFQNAAFRQHIGFQERLVTRFFFFVFFAFALGAFLGFAFKALL